MEESVVRQLSPLSLAFVGDAVFDLIVRTTCVMDGNRPVDKLNRDKVRIVNAAAQAALAERIEPLLTEDERAVLRRGKNAKIHSAAKNQTLADYHKATGLEALCGYLYLLGENRRLSELIQRGLRTETDIAEQASFLSPADDMHAREPESGDDN